MTPLGGSSHATPLTAGILDTTKNIGLRLQDL